ncbi:mandelate racemase [Alphaproteobacteria bacterium]|nr:mandelate racemase [Alphaproteobacteria bacterium]
MTKVTSLTARPVLVPMRRPLQTAGGAVSEAPLVLIDIGNDAGMVGRSYVFCYTSAALRAMTALLVDFSDWVIGAELSPFVIEEGIQKRLRLLGGQGLTGMALSGIDMALWDLLAKTQNLPLATLLGGHPIELPVYNSRGLGIMGPEKAAAEAKELVAEGYDAIKVRLGYPTAKDDVAVVAAVRAAVGDDIRLFSDYNQSLSVTEARVRTIALKDSTLDWIEEPVRFDDYDGHAAVRAVSEIPIQTGENCWGPHEVAKAFKAGACDYFMPDAGKIGGVTGWMRSVALAEAIGMPISSHLYPEFSSHLLCVTPTRHWLEYVDWAEPILAQTMQVSNGKTQPLDGPGAGLEWDEKAVEIYVFS